MLAFLLRMESIFFLLALVPIALLILMVVLIDRVAGLSRELSKTRDQWTILRALLPEKDPKTVDRVQNVEARPPIITPTRDPKSEQPAKPGGPDALERMHELFPRLSLNPSWTKPLRLKLFFALASYGQAVFAQAPLYQASVGPDPRAGLYAIHLSPELLGRSRPNLGDLRLVDSLGVEVPYLIRPSEAAAPKAAFVPYTILRNEVQAERTVVDIARPAGLVLNALHVWIRPAEVKKQVRVLGSDDRKQWFMVKDEDVALQGARGDPPHQVLVLNIPPSDYRYFRLLLNDSLTPPMRVLGVGHFTNDRITRHYTQSNPLQWEQQDSANLTLIHVRSPHPVPLTHIRFALSDTFSYQRSGVLRTMRTVAFREGRHARTKRVEATAATFYIGSDRSPLIQLTGSRVDTFDLVIDNGDDRPLRFRELKAFALDRSLLANLAQGMSYRLTTGESSLQAPRYNMEHFADDLSLPIDTLTHSAIVSIGPTALQLSRYDPSATWVWAVILALMVAMGYLAYRMLNKQT